MQILTVEFKYLTRSFVDLLEVKTITAFQEQQNGGENASRECPNCDSKRIVRERLSSRKNTVLLGISKLTINRLKVRSSGDISTLMRVQIPVTPNKISFPSNVEQTHCKRRIDIAPSALSAALSELPPPPFLQ